MDKAAISRQLVDEVDEALTIAAAVDNGTRQRAIRYYDGDLPAGDDKESRERQAVSLDVADMVEAVYAQIAPSFDDAGAVEFEALNAEDEAAARQESDVVRAMLVEGRGSDGAFVAMTEGIKDALLMRSGILALSVDKREEVTPEEWDLVPLLGVSQVTAPTAPGQRVTNIRRELMTPDEVAAAVGPNQDPSGEYFRLKFDRVDVERRLVVEAVAPEDWICSGVQERDPERMRFMADRVIRTRSDWVAAGLPEDEIAKLPACNPESYQLWITRQPGYIAPARAPSSSGDLVELWRCYAMLPDSKGSARAKRFMVWHSQEARRIVGEPQQVGRVCYALGQTIIYPHRREGVSLTDRMAEIQEAKSLGLRQWAENLTRVNRPRLGVDEALANLADARDATQDIIRIKGPNALQPVPMLDAGPSALAFMDYQDRMRSERGGASLDMQAAAAQIATNQTAQGIERQYSVKEQLAAMMARTFAETALRSMYRIAHYLLRTQWGVTISARLAGKWVEVDPRQWRARNGVVVRVGQSVTERARKAAALSQVMQAQMALMQQGLGGELVDTVKLYNAASDWIAATQLRSPDRYLIDPASQEAAQARQGKQQAAAQQEAKQAALVRAAMMLDKYKVDVASGDKTLDAIVKAAIEEAKLTTDPAALQQAQIIGAQQLADTNQDEAQVDAMAGPPAPGAA